MAKLPWPPSVAVLAHHVPDEVELDPGTTLWRVHAGSGPHGLRWDELRSFGPLPSGRFDPHVEPAHEQAELVGYFAHDWASCLAEVFQTNREIRPRRNDPWITGFETAGPVRLLDLRDTWAVAIGASHAINTGPKNVCRAWSRALRQAFPHADGLATTSAMTGRPSITAYAPMTTALPDRPSFSAPLAAPALRARVATVADEIGYTVG